MSFFRSMLPVKLFEDPGIGNVVTVLDEPVLERKAVLLLREGKTGCIRADILQRLLPREEKKAVFLRGPLRHQEAGMPPDGIEHGLDPSVFDRPADLQLPRLSGAEPVLYRERKVKGIIFQRLCAGRQAVRYAIRRFLCAGKAHVTGKAVLGRHGEFLPADTVFSLLHPSHEGKEDRRMPVPDGRLGGPEPLTAVFFVPDADRFRTPIGNGDFQRIVFQYRHVSLPP